MAGHVKKVISKLDDIKEELADKLDRVVHHAAQIVEAGGDVDHSDTPDSKMFPYPVGHCPLSTQPLYPPPSVERSEQINLKKLKEIGIVVVKCLFTEFQKVKNRSIGEMKEFSGNRTGK